MCLSFYWIAAVPISCAPNQVNTMIIVICWLYPRANWCYTHLWKRAAKILNVLSDTFRERF